MRRATVDYTIYSADYRSSRDSQGKPQEGHGECWDCSTLRTAKKKAMHLGVGSIVVRNFNQPETSRLYFDWWQSKFCYVWTGVAFKKAQSLTENKWSVSDLVWKQAVVLARFEASTRK